MENGLAVSGSIPNSETTGTAMEWQEFYLFNTNGTFTKSREENSVNHFRELIRQQPQSDGIFFELTYPNDS
jgi:hypothetical protein